MEENRQDLMKLIQSKFTRMSKGQKRLAEYILKSYDKAAFMTAAKLGNTVGVSESTVVRFANELGFSGYPTLQKSLQELIKSKLTSVQRMEISSDYMSEDSVLKNVLKADMENIRSTLEKIDTNTFDEVVNLIIKARRVYLVGFRSSQALVNFTGFYLNLILEDVRIVSSDINDIFEQLINVSKDDVVIGVGFPRYSRRTVEAIDFARSKEASVVVITDSFLSPLAANADHTLIAQSNIASFVDSIVAPLSVINALIVSIALKQKERTAGIFSDLENVWERYNVYTYKGKGAND